MDLTTLGVTFGYAVETAAGKKPTTFTQLKRCNEIAGISLETEQIDVSALEDSITQYAAGRQDTGGTWEVTFNLSEEGMTAIQEMYDASQTAKQSGLGTSAFFVVAETGKSIPLPDISQNEAATIVLSLVIAEYVGPDTKIEFSAGED